MLRVVGPNTIVRHTRKSICGENLGIPDPSAEGGQKMKENMASRPVSQFTLSTHLQARGVEMRLAIKSQ